ncbi:MAG: hypothetical protein FWG98_04365 [Candidatus Cloacimonetes bacterium]|nr:hypothetical protein [Candidatus Cloacimonadota bacterium]
MSQCKISADTLNLPAEFAKKFKGKKVELIETDDVVLIKKEKNTILIKLTNTEETQDEISNEAQTKQDINELENDPQMIRQRAWNSPDSLRKTRPLHLGKLDWTREDLYDR